MKELSIEEKAKRYDNAIKVAQRFYNNSVAITNKGLEDIFHELAESEDERIMKSLKILLQHFCNGYRVPGLDFPVSYKDMLAWLEKHGEQKTVDEIAKEVCKNKASAMTFLKSAGIINENGELAEQYRQSEQKTTDKVEPKFKVGQTIKKEGFNLGFTIVKIKGNFYYNDVGDHFPFTDQDNWELVEQNPVWNEEDDIMVHDIDYALRCQITYPISKLQSMSNWILNLKDRVQPKQEWSEEDYNEIETIACHLDNIDNEGMAEILRDIRDKYYHIIPQNTWQPSDEQMEGIECTIKTLKYQLNCGDNRLDSLYNDLKKLREE